MSSGNRSKTHGLSLKLQTDETDLVNNAQRAAILF